MEKFTVSQAAEALGCKLSCDKTVADVVIDNRLVTPGAMFVAIIGERLDGHTFVKDAFEKGAVCAVCSYIPEDCKDKPIIPVKDTGEAFLALAKWYRQKFNIPVIGITGSVGKTTTKEMVAKVLASKFKTLYTEGNLNNQIGLPKMCFKLDSTFEAAVLEMGMSGFGEIESLSCTALPTIGLITNIGVSHIEMLGSREGILKAKTEILKGMSNDAPLFLNGDDEMLSGMRKKIPERKVIFYAVHNVLADFYTENGVFSGEGSTFDIVKKATGARTKIFLPAAGIHNVLNACAAFAIGDYLGISAEQCAKALSEYVPSGMRQRVVKRGGITVIEDCYNASPDSVKASLSVLKNLDIKGKRIAVLGDMLELGDYSQRAHGDCGAAAAGNADILFVYGDNAGYYLEGAKSKGLECLCFNDKNELLSKLCEYVKDNDAVLFKASRRMKLEEVIEGLYKERESK